MKKLVLSIITMFIVLVLIGCNNNQKETFFMLVLQDPETSEVVFIEKPSPEWDIMYDNDNGVFYCDFGHEGKWITFK